MKSVNYFSQNLLSLCVLALMLSACGGGSGGGDSAALEKPSYPEPQKDVPDDSVLGFYDDDAQDQARNIRPDLDGSFQAMIQFGQSHVVDPNGNEAKRMPRLTAEREALVLVTPAADMGEVSQLTLEIYRNGQFIRQVDLDEPAEIPASDQPENDNRPRVSYSKRAWTAKLAWDEVRPGLSLKVIDQQKRSGELFESKIDFAAPGELVLNNIRIGMLTAPPVSVGHYMLLEPEKAGTDYFQAIPAAQMTVAKYDDIYLPRVMVSNGTIYDSASSTEGGHYSGDMREDVGKSTFSVGINLANWGVTSASMSRQDQPQLTEMVVAHHSRGKYANGEQGHGLSGGNGMLTLYDSVGNEFSHEIGHHYGLGHYPGRVEIDKEKNIVNDFWAAHHADSGWGYIGNRNKMRGNLTWTSTALWDGSNSIPNFKNLFPYGKDAMSGGYTASSISRYTHYTGYSTFLKIQPHFDRDVWDEASPTGFKKWNPATRAMEVSQPRVPAPNQEISKAVWFNSSNGNYLKPRLFGVPVITILGGYDPVNQAGLLYPAARSNWGNVFSLPAANTAQDQASCWLNVQYANRMENIALAPQRMDGNANKLHVNLAVADAPEKADLYCKKANQAAVLLSSVDIPAYAGAIKPAVKIGRGEGYSALRRIELPALEQALSAQANSPIMRLKPDMALLYDSYKANLNELSALAAQQLTRYAQQRETVYRLNRWMNVYHADLANRKAEAAAAFSSFKDDALGLKHEDIFAQSALLKNNANCLKAEALQNGSYDVYISGSSGCKGDPSEQWVYDGLGRIHSRLAIGQCLTGNGNSAKITLTQCNTVLDSQIWAMDAAQQAIKQAGQCMDLNTGHLVNNRQILIRYGCSNNANQKWTTLTPNQSLMLSYLKPKNLKLLAELK